MAGSDPLGDQSRIGVVVGQSVHIMIERIKASCGEESNLTHGPAEHPTVSKAALDGISGAGKQRSAGRAEAFGESHGNQVKGGGKLRRRATTGDGGIPEPSAVEIAGDAMGYG